MRWMVVGCLLAGCMRPGHDGELHGSSGTMAFRPRAALARWTARHEMLVVRFTDFECSCDAEEPLGNTPQLEMRFQLRPVDTRPGRHEIRPKPDESPAIIADALDRWPRANGHLTEGTREISGGNFWIDQLDTQKLVIAFDIESSYVSLHGVATAKLCPDGDSPPLFRAH